MRPDHDQFRQHQIQTALQLWGMGSLPASGRQAAQDEPCRVIRLAVQSPEDEVRIHVKSINFR